MKEEALHYHRQKPSGKLEIQPTKKMESEWDLSLAYSPGVAEPCRMIHKDPDTVFEYTGKGNLVAVVTNGTAVLGLGSIGPLAGKPVMEGKAVLFKKFAGINVFDIEIKTKDPKEFVNICKNLEPSFGGINLEDISAPECFEIEESLKKEMNIPVFHDDQHGTAIITAAALLNACYIHDKKMESVRVVFSGAGAAAIACARLLLSLGVKRSHITLCDSKGVIYKGRHLRMNPYKEEFALSTDHRTLKQALKGADVFIGLSVKDILTEEMVKSMSAKPIVFAMANPDPEIHPEHAKKANPNVIVATGRTDFPNQVNNVLGFPFIFRGALDVRARTINEPMKLAAVYALADLARSSVPHSVAKAYQGEHFEFGSDYIIPKPFDMRVLTKVAPAVAKAAMESGVARRLIKDFNSYVQDLETYQSETRGFIRSAINRIRHYKKDPPVLLFPEGQSPKVLKALNTLMAEKVITPVLIGDKREIKKSIEKMNLLQLKTVKIIKPEEEQNRLKKYAHLFYERKKDKGVTLEEAGKLMLQYNYFAAMSVEFKEGDGLVTGATDTFVSSVVPVLRVFGSGHRNTPSGVNLVLLKNRIFFFADTAFNINPTAEQVAHIAVYTAGMARYFGVEPRIAMLSYLNFSDSSQENPLKMKEAVKLVKKWKPELKIAGEVQADIAVNEQIAKDIFPNFAFDKGANVLIFPNLDSGNIAYKLVQQLGPGEVLGPLLMGIKKPVNILQRTCNVEDIINTSILTGLKVQAFREMAVK